MELRAELVFEGTRKDLVNDIANALGVKAQYQGAPTFAYKVACFTFTRDNQLVFTSEEQTTEATDVMDSLFRAGRFEYSRVWFDGEELPSSTAPVETPVEEPARTATVAPHGEETEPAATTAPAAETAPTEARFTVNLANDLTDAQYQNLRNLIEQKENLLDLAFPGTLKLIQRTPDGRLEFKSWFPYDNNGEAYLLFAARMVDMAKAAKRISTKQNPVVNPKYQFRCFLLRLGFIGKEYGPMRKALMQNLTGNSAWLRGSKDA